LLIWCLNSQKLLQTLKVARGCSKGKKLLKTPKVAHKLPSTIYKGLFRNPASTIPDMQFWKRKSVSAIPFPDPRFVQPLRLHPCLSFNTIIFFIRRIIRYLVLPGDMSKNKWTSDHTLYQLLTYHDSPLLLPVQFVLCA
jgi:hypothetical protein